MTWFSLIKAPQWETEAYDDYPYGDYHVKDKVWEEEAGLEFKGGRPTMPEFEKHLGRKLKIDDMSSNIYDPNNSIVSDRFGKAAVQKLADEEIEDFMQYSNGVIDLEYSQSTVMEGIRNFQKYILYYPDGKYADEIEKQLKGKKLRRNRFGFDLII